MNQNDELPIRAWWTTSESSAHLSFSKPYTQGVYSEPEALVLLSDAQRIRDERDELRKSLALVRQHAEVAWHRGHAMGIESARQRIDGANQARAQADADRYADNARLTGAMLAAEDERDRLRAENERLKEWIRRCRPA